MPGCNSGGAEKKFHGGNFMYFQVQNSAKINVRFINPPAHRTDVAGFQIRRLN